MAIKAFNKNLIGFRQKLGDFTRSFMFRIDIPWWNDYETLSMLARSATLPAYKLKTSEIGYQGLKLRVATVAEFEPTFTVEILADEKQVLRSNIMKWMSYTYDPATMEASMLQGAGDASDNSYKRDDVVFSQLTRDGTSVMTYNFAGVFPTSCDSIKPSHDETDPAKFSVTFAYDFFTFKTGSGSANVTPNPMGADNSKVGITSEAGDKAGATDAKAAQDKNKPTAAK
jgi:hypothetical protein